MRGGGNPQKCAKRMALGPMWRMARVTTKSIRLDFWAVFLSYFDSVELGALKIGGLFALSAAPRFFYRLKESAKKNYKICTKIRLQKSKKIVKKRGFPVIQKRS
jgi:hypothetical protein